MSITKEEALKYHSEGRHGKIEVVATKPCFTARELSLAYTPGVAIPCLEIKDNVDDVYNYTAKSNLVAVVSNGTAVLGLGNIGPEAGKPVMEGKGVLFKRFADIDVFDIELKTQDTKEIIRTVQLMEPTFGGINLEDIKAPQCFEIEEELKKTMNIPVFHDDQHGTAIISCAALINAAELAGKKLEDMRVVVVGAGAAGIACSKLYVTAGVKKENISMFDSKGHIHKGRNDLNKYKEEFAQEHAFASLEEAMEGADVFMGLSKGGLVSKEMVKAMAPDPVIFAMANPDPEITYPDAKDAREDVIMATGRSDYPNQVNNVLGFPFIFRGALDVRASAINEEMKMAAVKALANLAKEEVPDVVINAYGGQEFSYGREYIIPKPFDPRVLWTVAPAVAKAAVDTGVARKEITDWNAYVDMLKERLGFSNSILRVMVRKAQKSPKKIVYSDGEEDKTIQAAQSVSAQNIGTPILLGNLEKIKERIEALGYDVNDFEIHDPLVCERCDSYAEELFKLRQRKGVTLKEAKSLITHRNYFGVMMVNTGDADIFIGGSTYSYPKVIRPALEIIGTHKNTNIVSAFHIVIINRKVLFFADTSVNLRPNAKTLAEIAMNTADLVKGFNVEPKISMLSFSNFGSVRDEASLRIKEATEIVKSLRPDLIVDGEMDPETALNPEYAKDYPFSLIQGDANILIFPNLSAGNVAYKIIENLTSATIIGPILVGMKKPVHVLYKGATVDDIVNLSAIAVVEADIAAKKGLRS
jgi:malate dehydrogenase (oxaloacetate-decarboxylating)(NADP+)